MTKRNNVFRGDRLKAIRERRDLTQEELAERLGSGQSQLNKYENGKADPSPDVLVRLAEELEVTADWLLGLVDKHDEHLHEKELTSQEWKLLMAFRKGDLRGIMRVAADAVTPEPDNQTGISGVDTTANDEALDIVE